MTTKCPTCEDQGDAPPHGCGDCGAINKELADDMAGEEALADAIDVISDLMKKDDL